jgi:hypothetical protein
MTPNSPPKSVLRAGRERRQFLNLARQVSEAIGTQFFSMLVRELSGALDAECVYIGEFFGGEARRVRTPGGLYGRGPDGSLGIPTGG